MKLAWLLCAIMVVVAADRRRDDFVPLECNARGFGTCEPWSEVVGTDSFSGTRPVTIPCGTCVYMDVQRAFVPAGLDIHGQLVIKNSVIVYADYIVVQGELLVESIKPVDGIPDIEFIMTGSDDQTFRPIDSNANACGGFRCTIGPKAFVVAGGRVNFLGLSQLTPTWLHLYNVTGDPIRPTGIVVDSSVRGRWSAGAEILITSHTTNWTAHQTRTITEAKNFGSEYVEFTLDAPIDRPTTLLDSPDFAVEVALLSRNIRIDGGSDAVDTAIGGHFWFMNTPNVSQSFIGVEVVHFGQQGILGRYPIHVHFCGDQSASVIAKNTVRNSFQRCVVVHGTSGLRVEENVAFNTRGHCFILEDGYETGNEFINNLGAGVGAVGTVIPDSGFNGIETDNEPSVFWITNPSNTFIGNVAAGSQSFGFWFELMLRGERAHEHPFLDPKRASLTLFRDNVAHSCLGRAVSTYPSGYFADSEASFIGLKAYRNSNAGLFIHNSHSIAVRDSLFADNRIALDIDRADDISVSNTTIVGRSGLYNTILESVNARDKCSSYNMPVIGIDLHTWKNNPDDSGVFFRNVSFSGFSGHPCDESVPIMLDPNVKTGKFNLYTSFEGIDLGTETDFFNFCRADEAGIQDIYYVDIDGSFSEPKGQTTATSTLLSLHPNMLQFVDLDTCTNITRGCYTYCKDTCFRTVRFEVDPSISAGYDLTVCGRYEDGKCISFSGVRDTDDDAWSLKYRIFAAHLPVGLYDAFFTNKAGDMMWPNFAHQIYEDNLCSLRGRAHSVNLIIPPVDKSNCTNLVQNSHQNRLDLGPWMFRFGGAEVIADAGISGNAVVGIINSGRTTIIQNLDNRCFDAMRGSTYTITAVLKQELRNGSPFICALRERDCPWVGIYTESFGFRPITQVSEENPSNGWQTYEGVVDIDDSFPSNEEVFLYVDSNLQFSRLFIDTVTMTVWPTNAPRPAPFTGSSCSNLIANSDMELGHYGFWIDNGFGSVAITDGFKSSAALHFHDRVFTWNGPKYIAAMDYSCLTPGSSWNISAHMKLVDPDTGNGFNCDIAWSCPAVRVAIFDNVGRQILVKKLRQYRQAWNASQFNAFEMTLHMPDEFGEIGDVDISIRDFPIESDLIVDDFHFQPIVV